MDNKNKTFQQLYKDAVNTPIPPTPREAFLQQMAEITGRSAHTIYAWGIGARKPDICAAKLLEQALGIDRHILFPELKKKK